jgi:hypothetical protein
MNTVPSGVFLLTHINRLPLDRFLELGGRRRFAAPRAPVQVGAGWTMASVCSTPRRDQGKNVTETPFGTFEPLPHGPKGSRYQNWKFHVLPAWIRPSGGKTCE